jgi:hypothetical protein
MSKKYAVRGFGWKLAVAALAVAGVVGMAVAQTKPTASSGQYDKMKVSFEIKKTLEIECKTKLVDATILKATNVALVANSGADPGNLGTIRVKTNSTGWDILMTTDFGGRLVKTVGGTLDKGSCPSGQSDPWNPGQCLVPLPDTIIGGSRTPLMYSSTTGTDVAGVIGTTHVGTNTTKDEVQLEVSIGLAFLGSQLAATAPATNMYGIGAPSNYVIPAVIDNEDLEKSGSVLGSSTARPAAISFADVLGNHYDNNTPGAPAITGLGGRDWSDIADDGFPTPNNSVVGTTPVDEVDNQYFFVNVGLAQTTGLQDKISGNDEGIYEETFTFDLAANF